MNLTLYNCQFYYRKATRVQTAGWVTEYRHNSSHVYRDTCDTCAALYSRAEQSLEATCTDTRVTRVHHSTVGLNTLQ